MNDKTIQSVVKQNPDGSTETTKTYDRKEHHGMPAFITQYLSLWALGALGSLALAGALGYMDLRHVQRIEHRQSVHMSLETRLLDKIDEADTGILRLNLYNTLGSTVNAPARKQIILETEKRKQRYERELEVLQNNRPKE